MNVAMMTSGGLAPCLSSSVAYLVEFWGAALKAGTISGLTIRMYFDGYKGVLTGDSQVLSPDKYDDCVCLHDLGGSPIGNSRVKVSLGGRGEEWRAREMDEQEEGHIAHRTTSIVLSCISTNSVHFSYYIHAHHHDSSPTSKTA